MAEQPDQEDLGPPVSQAGFWAALALTVVILGASIGYLWIKAGMVPTPTAEQPSPLAPGSVIALLISERVADIGQFVSGIAGAIAFIWIVAAYLQQSSQLTMQRKELVLQRRELKMQRQETKRLADEARAQVKVLKDTGAGAARDAFIRALELYERQLEQLAAEFLRMIIQNGVDVDQHDKAWIAYQRGDRNAFYRSIRQATRDREKEFFERVDHIAGARIALEQFCKVGDGVVAQARAVDPIMENICERSEWRMISHILEGLLEDYPKPAKR